MTNYPVYSLESNLRGRPDRIQNVATGQLLTGQICQLPNGQAVIVLGLTPGLLQAGDQVEQLIAGEFEVAKDSAAYAVGDKVYFSLLGRTSLQKSSTVPGDFYLGVCSRVALAGDTTVFVQLNKLPTNRPALNPAFVSRAQAIVYSAGAAKFALLDACDNPDGLLILAALAEVTAAPHGGAEDVTGTLVLTIYDSADNALDTITVAAATTAGTQVPGAKSILGAAAIAAKVPAGRTAYAEVTTACSGAGAAGAVNVRLLCMPLD